MKTAMFSLQTHTHTLVLEAYFGACWWSNSLLLKISLTSQSSVVFRSLQPKFN